MIDYNVISSGVIFTEILRRFPKGTITGQYEGDIQEFIGQACEYLNFCGSSHKTTKKVYVENYRALMPCNIIKMNGEPTFNGKPLFYDNNTTFRFDKNSKEATRGASLSINNTQTAFDSKDFQVDYTRTTQQNVEKIISEISDEQNQNQLNPSANTYFIEGGWIRTSFECGELWLDVNELELDDCGFLMIPKSIYFIDAVTWYVTKMLILQGVVHPVVNYQTANQSWVSAKVRCVINIEVADRAKMNAFRNKWVRLIPLINPENQYYSGFNTQENLLRS